MGESIVCARYAAVTQTVFGDIGSTSFCLLGCDLNRVLKDICIYFFSSGRCYLAIISFLSAGAGVFCSVRHNSCSVLPDCGVKNNEFSNALIFSCLNMVLLSYFPWLLVPPL